MKFPEEVDGHVETSAYACGFPDFSLFLSLNVLG
jgi:hypothetical protein